jgi:hypothetical protein
MLQLSPFIALARFFSSGERHFSAFDLPSIDYPPRHLSASTRAAHVAQTSQVIPAPPRADGLF